MPSQDISEIVRCRHAVTADMALRIDWALSMTAESWLALQRLYDPDRARATIDVSRIDRSSGRHRRRLE